MKICASCGASVPDQALICTACGSQEFTMAAPGYGQQDSYGYDDQQQYGQQYDQNGYGYDDQQQYGQQYDQNGYGYDDQQQYGQQYDQNGYGYDDQQQYGQQYDQNGYGYDDQQQYGEQYDQNSYGYDQQQYGQQYDQNGYGYDDQQQYGQQYDQNGYGYDDQQQYDQNDYGYDNQQQYGQQYDQNGYAYDNQQQYDQNGYGYDDRQQYGQQQPVQAPVQQPVQQPVEQPVQQPIEQPVQPPVAAAAVSEEKPAPKARTKAADKFPKPEEKKPAPNPYESSKDFKFERKKPVENETGIEAPEPEPLKGFAKVLDLFTNTPDHTNDFDPNDIAKSKTTSIIALFGLTFWVPFAFSPRSVYSRFYANQGLLMLIVLLPFTLIYAMFAGIIGVACTTSPTLTDPIAHLSIMGVIMDLFFFAICYFIPGFMIFNGIKNIRAGKAKEIPFVGFLRLVR